MKTLVLSFSVLLNALVASSSRGQEDVPFTRLFDTGAMSPEPLTAKVLIEQSGWHQVPEDNITSQFSGDAVLMNDKLAVVLRKQSRSLEIYSKTASGLERRTVLGLAADETSPAGLATGLKIIENSSGGGMIEVAFKDAGPGTMRFRITTGEAILEIRCGENSGFVDVQTKSRYVVVPDYFGDDMVYGHEASHGLCLPAENFFLQLIDGGDAIVMAVSQSSEQDAWLAEAGQPKDEQWRPSRIRCAKDKNIWLAFLESPGIWHAAPDLTKDDWKSPFPAKWRSSLVRENGLTDSWDLDQGPRPEQRGAKQQGPVVIYPMDRSITTPLTITCPTDVMRNTLGVGPCQYILACEGLAAQGDPTPNSVMGWVEKQFEQRKDKKASADIQERLDQMAKHVADARSRIDRYAAFAVQLRKSLPSEQGPFNSIVDELDRSSAAGLTTSSSPARARQLAGEVAALIGKEDTLVACRTIGEQLRSIGTLQDRSLAKCRMAVRRLKQQSKTILAARQPVDAKHAREIQHLAEDMLQNK